MVTEHDQSHVAEATSMKWEDVRQIVLARDGSRCVECGHLCAGGDADIHHLIPRYLDGMDEPSNLVTVCDGCHAAIHPNLQVSLSRRFIERWALRLARWLDWNQQLPDSVPNLGGVLRLLGIEKLRGKQLDVVLAALRGESVLLVSPTGSGKTLCFQLPTLLRSGTSFVISPLKALMNDQISGLQRKRIPGTFINGDIGPDEKRQRYELLENGALKFFYCTPERFDAEMVRPAEVRRVSGFKPIFFVVDEAHCIDRWGNDFRPNYSRLGTVKTMLGNPPVLAFTATAGVKTQRRILDSLGIPNAKVIVSGVDRPNIALLRLPVVDDAKRFAMIKELCDTVPAGRTMIFVPTVKVGNNLRAGLERLGMSVPFYHAKCGTATEREMLLGRFTGRHQPEVRTIICTNAFGMGIDVSDVRLIIHWQHPASVEDYLQEFGRAGRDGRQSVAVLLVNEAKDKGLLEFMAKLTADQTEMDGAARAAVLQGKRSQIQDMSVMARAATRCFRRDLLRYFGDDHIPVRRGWALRIVDWLFSSRTMGEKTKHCCDRCAAITPSNCASRVRALFREVSLCL